MTDNRDERACFYHAAECLDSAYKEVGDAADDLRDLVDAEFHRAIKRAKKAINEAKDIIGA